MHEPVDSRQRHGLFGEDRAPVAERLVGGDEQGAVLVPGTDQFEQHAGFGLILTHVGDVVEDEQVVLVQFADGGLEHQFAARDLEFLRNGPRKLDSAVSEILHRFQAAKLRLAWSKYTSSGVRRSSAL